jgi:hypothetical protein
MKKAVLTLLMLTAFSYLYCANGKDMTNIQEEIWVPVIGFSNYSVSNMGRVYSHKYKRILVLRKRPDFGFDAQLRNRISRKVFRIHRLVAIHFIPNPKNLLEIDHKDNDRSNNAVSNLQWCTRSENIKWSYERGRDRKGGQYNKGAKFTNIQANQIREQYLNGTPVKKLKDKYHCGENTIWAIVNLTSYKPI